MLKEKFKHHNIILGSSSPRRIELLHGLDIDFITNTIAVEENFPEQLKGAEITDFLSRKKAEVFELQPKDVMLTSDTLVTISDEVLGKPKDADDAFQMLKKLSGKAHDVITSVTIQTTNFQKTVNHTTKVFFKELTDDEILYYIENYKPFDKAGAYGIQEWIGFIGVERIEGSYFNVVGFPVHLVYKLLQEVDLR